MATGYTKEFLVEAFISRYRPVMDNKDFDFIEYVKLINTHYDEVGKDKFRVAASLDAAAIKEYKQSLK